MEFKYSKTRSPRTFQKYNFQCTKHCNGNRVSNAPYKIKLKVQLEKCNKKKGVAYFLLRCLDTSDFLNPSSM